MMAHRDWSVRILPCRLSLLLLIVLAILMTFPTDSEGSGFAVDNVGKEKKSSQEVFDVEGKEGVIINTRGKQNPKRRRNKDRNGGAEEDTVASSSDPVKREHVKPEEQERNNFGKRLRRLMRHDLDLFELLINNTYRVHESQIAGVDVTEPHCVLHHEYAVVFRSDEMEHLDSNARYRLRFYVNQHQEFRFYICSPCRVCPPEAPEIFPCQRKSDAVCRPTVKCIIGMVYDPVQNLCVPPPSPVVETTSVQATYIPSSLSLRAALYEANDYVVQVELKRKVDEPLISPSSSPRKPLSIEITIIAVGVVTLNLLVTLAIIIKVTRKRWRNQDGDKVRKMHRFDRSIINNAPSTPIGHNPSSFHLHNGTMTLPSISNQVDNRTSIIAAAADERTVTVEINTEIVRPSHPADCEVPLMHFPRIKESNLNVYHQPGYEQGAHTVLIPKEDELDTPASIQVLRGKDPFWLVMIGQFGPKGGTLSCEDSDVILEIPPGAIPANRQEQIIIARISLCPDSIGPKSKDPKSLWLTPLVALESPGLERFKKNVRLRLPHRARMQPGWIFIVHFTDPTADTKCNGHVDPTAATIKQDPEAATSLFGDEPTWFCVKRKWHPGKAEKCYGDEGGVTFTVDEKYMNVSTSHFSEYVCSGCNAKHPLNLEAAVYWNHLKVEGHEQMDLNVYIIDVIKDTRKANVEKNERSSKCPGTNSGTTGYFPLALEYTAGETSSLVVCVDEESMGADWKWRLETFNGLLRAERVMSIESVIRGCCSSLLSSRQMFSFYPNNLPGGEQLHVFQAMVCIKQPNQPELQGDLQTPIPVTVPLVKGSRAAIPANNNVNQKATVITDEHIEFVSENLQYEKWRPLYRKLMGKGADNGIAEILVRDPHDLVEQKHGALVGWRKSKGRLATVEALVTALEDVKLQDLADSLPSCCTADAPYYEDGPAFMPSTRIYEETDL